jgi:hypothetical protein
MNDRREHGRGHRSGGFFDQRGERLIAIWPQRWEAVWAVIIGHPLSLIHARPMVGVERRNRIVVAAIAAAIEVAIEPVDAVPVMSVATPVAATVGAAMIASIARVAIAAVAREAMQATAVRPVTASLSTTSAARVAFVDRAARAGSGATQFGLNLTG